MASRLEAFVRHFLLPHLVFKESGARRFRLASQYARGEILEIGCSAQPNPLWHGNVTALDIETPGSVLPPCYVKFIRGDAAQLDSFFPPASFDTIVALEVIEHLPDYCAFLASASTRLRPSGLLVLSTPNPYSWITIVANVFFPRGFSYHGCGETVVESGQATLGPYFGHIHLHAPRILNLCASERGLQLIAQKASTGLDFPFLAANTMYVFRKRTASSPEPFSTQPHGSG